MNGSDCGICTLINLTKFMRGEFARGYAIQFEYDRVRCLR